MVTARAFGGNDVDVVTRNADQFAVTGGIMATFSPWNLIITGAIIIKGISSSFTAANNQLLMDKALSQIQIATFQTGTCALVISNVTCWGHGCVYTFYFPS